MANNLIQIKRTSVSGRAANTLTLPNAGELALNMTDGILYSTNGQNVFEIGANNTNVNVSNTLTIRHVSANGSNGTTGQVLTSNGSVAYWADVSAAASVNVNAQYVWTNLHTFTNTVTMNYATVGNSSVNTQISPGYISVGNTSTNTQIEPGIVRLSGSQIFVGNDVVINSTSIFAGNVDIALNSITVGNVDISTNNIQIEGRYVLTSETAGVANNSLHLGGVPANGYQTTAGLADNVATLTANNTNFVGSISAANVVSNAQLSANLGNYQTTAGLASNVATLAANSATYLNGNTASDLNTYADNKAANAYSNAVSYVDGKSYVNTSQLSSNLANYQTTAGLAGNVATLTSNNATYAFGKTEDALNVNSAFNANNSAYLGGVAAADYQTEAGLAANVAKLTSNNATYAYGKTESSLDVNSALTSNNASYLGGNTASDLRTYTDNKAANAYSNAVSYVDGKSYVNSTQLSNNLSNYALLSGASFTGNVSANNANTLYDLTVGRNLTVAGNLNVTGNVTVIGANNLSIVDNFIYLNSNNTIDNIDIGFAGNYNDGVYRHTGFFRDASDGYWKVFDGYTPEPDANVNIDTANSTFRIADFWANSARIGNTTVYATINSTAYSGSANNTTYFGGNDITNFVRTTGAYTLSGNITFNSNVSFGAGLRANGSYGNAGQVLVSNGAGGIYWSEDQLYGNVVANAITVNILTVNFISLNTGTITVGNSTVNTDIGNNYISVGNSSSYSNIYSSYISIGNSVTNTVINSSSLNVKTIYANGSIGSAGQILASNGTGLYWTNDQGVNAITANSLTANYVSVTRGTLTVGNSTVNTDIGNNYVSVGNTSGFVNVYSNRILIGSASINSTVYTGTASPNLNATFVWTNNHTFSDVVTFDDYIYINSRIRANGSFGTAGQVLASNGTGVYWTNDQGANAITANSLTANFVSITSGTLTVGNSTVNTDIGNNYISVGNTSGFVNVYSDRIYIGNSAANATINSTIYTGTANSANYIRANNGIVSNASGVFVKNGFNIVVNSGGVYVNTTTSYNWTNSHTFDGGGIFIYNAGIYTANGVTFGPNSGISINGNYGTNGQVLATNGSAIYWTNDQGANAITANSLTANFVSITTGTLSVGNSTVNTDIGNNYVSVGNTLGFVNVYSDRIYIGNSAANATINSTIYTGTANNATYFGGNAITNFVRTSGAHTLSGNITFNGNVTIGTTAGINANGGFGTSGQYLTSNGSSIYWSSPGAASVNTAASYTWTNTHNFQANVTFGSFSPSINIAVSAYTTKFSVYSDPSQAPNGGLWSSYGLELSSGPITLYDTAGSNGQVIMSNGSVATWQTLPAAVVNVNAQYTWTNTQTFTNTVTFSQTINGTANNTSFVGTVSAANVVSNAQLSANLANYQTTAGLSANVATLTANNTNFVGTVSAANVVSNAQLSANLANYQTTAGLSANVATLTANNTSFVGSVSAANVVSNAQLSANLANYQTSAGLAANVATLTANNTSFVGSVSAANVVSNAQLSANLANYQTTAGLAANVATLAANNASYLGGVAAANYVNTSGAYTLSGNLTFNGNVTIGTSAGLNANGTYGTSGQVLTSNGTTVYWSTVTGGAGVNTDAQYTWTNTQTFSNTVFLNAVSANGGLGTAGQVLTSNGSDTYWSTVSGGGGANVTSAGISATSDTFTANGSADTFTLSESIANAPDIIVSINGLVQTPTTHYGVSGANITFTSIPENNDLIEVRIVGLNPDLNAQYTWTNTHTHNANVVYGTTAGISANGSFGTAGQVLTSNGTTVYWSTVTGGGSTNVDAQYTWTNTQTFSNTITFSQTINGTANNSLYLGGTIASGYQTTAGLAANVATLTANNTTNLGGVAAASYVQNTDSRTLSGNLVFSGANNTISGNLTIAATGELIITNGAGINANGSFGAANQVLTTNGSSVYWSTVTGGGGGGINTLSFNGFYSGYNTSAIIGSLRRYFANNITVNKLTAWVGVTSGSNVTLTLKKNGVEIANVVVAAGNSIANTTLSSNVIADTDYLTLDLSSGSGTDIGVRVDYTPY